MNEELKEMPESESIPENEKDLNKVSENDSVDEGGEEVPYEYEEVLSKDEVSVLAAQKDATVKWAVEDFYNENGLIKNQGEMSKLPPSLVVKSSNGDKVSFLLTKELSKEFSRIFKEVYNAHYGIKPFREASPKEKGLRIIEWFSEHRFIAALVGLLVVLFIFGQIATMV